MDYIFNVKAKIDKASQTQVTLEFLQLKRKIENDVIKVKAELDTTSLTLKSIQEQLNSQKLTLNIGNVTFDQSGTNAVKNATDKVAQSAEQATDAVKKLNSAYKNLTIEDVNALFGRSLPTSQKIGSGEFLDVQDSVRAMNELKQKYEEVWGKGKVDIISRTQSDTHAIESFTVAVKNAENQIYKFQYAAKAKEENNTWSFDYSKSMFGESNIRQAEQYDSILKQIDKDFQNIIASSHQKTKPILGIDIGDDGSISKNSLVEQQSEKLQTQIKTYVTNYQTLQSEIQKYQNKVRSGEPVSQAELDLLRQKTDAFKRLAETIRSAQYADTQMSSKSVINQKAIVGEELKAFEADVKNSNVATQELVERINQVKENLSKVGDRNSFRTVYEDLRKLEAEFEQMQKVSQSNAQRESFGVDYTKASKSLDEVIKKIQELGSNESNLTFRTTDLLEAFSNISDKYSLQTFNKMLAQATKEVNAQTHELQNQEKEWQRLTDLANKAYSNATNSSSNSNAVQNAESIKLLRSQYDLVIESVNRLKTSTSETFAENKRAAEQAIQGFIGYSTVLQNSEKEIKATGDEVKKLQEATSKGLFTQNANDNRVVELRQEVTNLANRYQELQAQFQNEGATSTVTQGFAQLSSQIQSTSQKATELQQNLRQTNAELTLTGQKSNLNNRIETWLKNNTKASTSTVQALKQLQAQIQSADKASLKNLTQQFKDITRNAELAGEAGKSWRDSIDEKISKFSSWFGVSQFIMGAINEGKQAIVTLKEVDTILTEISKTSERSAESLAKLGESAFDTASKYGVSVQNYLTGVQEMARAGYETMGEGQSEKMAELALLTQAAGDVTDSVARDYLIATDAAYQLGGSIEKLQSILDSQNKVNINAFLYRNI